jgi:hypothetical protein
LAIEPNVAVGFGMKALLKAVLASNSILFVRMTNKRVPATSKASTASTAVANDPSGSICLPYRNDGEAATLSQVP